MLVQMLSGHIVDVFPDAADAVVARGEGKKVVPDWDENTVMADGGIIECGNTTVGDVLYGGVCATRGIEMAMIEPKTERARIKYERTPKSRSDEVKTWLESLFQRNRASNQ